VSRIRAGASVESESSSLPSSADLSSHVRSMLSKLPSRQPKNRWRCGPRHAFAPGTLRNRKCIRAYVRRGGPAVPEMGGADQEATPPRSCPLLVG
jgi:hypothetical protein